MKYLAPILLLFASLALIPSQAQTPYDAFAPETSRPMLGLEAVSPVSRERPTAVESISDSAVFAIVIDQEQQSVYLLNLAERTLLAAAPLTDDVLKWLSVDPLSDKYPNISPYAYCAWNPIKFVDPDGKIAVVAGEIAQKRLLSTLSCSERKYVSFDKKGNINARRLNRCKSTSHNMTALKALTNSKDVTYYFLVQDKSSNGKTDMQSAGGVTEMYGLDKDASPDPSIVNIISGAHLEGEAAARNMAHEAFVHAYLYETNGHDGRTAGHDRPNIKINLGVYIDPDTGVEYPEIDGVFEDHPNDLLNRYDEKAQKEASTNFNCGL